MKDATREAILQEIVDLIHTNTQLADDEITTKDVAEELDIDMEEAYRTLRREARNGKLTKRRLVIDGHIVCAWKKGER